MFDIKSAAQRLIDGCRVTAHNGVTLFTPDGKGHYPALWTRDFTYMVEYAGELMQPDSIRAAIDYLLDTAAFDGWIPDRTYADGTPWYTAGLEGYPADRNLDNGPFIVICADAYLNMLSPQAAAQQFSVWEKPLRKAVEYLPVNESGLIYNDPAHPHSPYGFTDSIAKTGCLCMESILLWRAYNILAARCGERRYREAAAKIERNLPDVFGGEGDLLLAATVDCRQPDIWASCYAISVGFPLPTERRLAISRSIIKDYDRFVLHGHLRHLPLRSVWQRTFTVYDHPRYQNGGFWATPSGWLAETLALTDRDLALKTLDELLDYFDKYGIFEWITPEENALDTYVVSATNIYGACKRLGLCGGKSENHA